MEPMRAAFMTLASAAVRCGLSESTGGRNLLDAPGEQDLTSTVCWTDPGLLPEDRWE